MVANTRPVTSTTSPDPVLRSHDALARQDARRGLLAGTIGALAMLVALIVLRAATGALSLIDALADAMLLYMPMSLFSLALELFDTQAKTLLLVGLLVAFVAAGALVGRSYARQTAGARRIIWVRAGWIGIVVFTVLVAFLLLFASQRLPDEVSGGRIFPVAGVVLVAAAVFAAAMAGSLQVLRRQDLAPDAAGATADESTLSRRRLSTRAGLVVASLAALVVVGREVGRVAGRKVVGGGPTGTISPAITPNEDFYVISKNFIDPDPERGDDWTIRVDGAVERELTLSRADLEAIARPDFASTLTCISNPIGGPLIGTANWTGASLAEVLTMAGVRPGAVDVVLEGEDGYTDSFPIERAMAPEPAIVWKMNGEDLTRLHGTPVRVIVPGLYGIKNVKWLTTITVSTSDHKGYWQDRGWTEEATIKTSSVIDVPSDKDVLEAGAVEVGGFAFAGDRGISRVEVSTDDGESWTEATIVENPSPAGLSWVIWKWEWIARSGTYPLRVRATDGTGEVQTSERADTLPDGASGWHRVTVGVA